MVLASRGLRELPDGTTEPVEDEIAAAALRRRARRVWIMVAAATAVAGGLILASARL